MRDALLVVALGWTWAIPGAWLWRVAGRAGAMLPGLPTAVWSLPGAMWSRSPIAFALGLLLLSCLPLTPAGVRLRLGRWRWSLVAILVVVVLVHLTWGVALFLSLRNA